MAMNFMKTCYVDVECQAHETDLVFKAGVTNWDHGTIHSCHNLIDSETTESTCFKGTF